MYKEYSTAKRVPVESTDVPGWYVVPGYSEVVVNSVGDVLDLNTRTLLGSKATDKQEANKIGYVRVVTKSDKTGKPVTVGAHKLVASTFLEVEDPSHVVINHKDGVKDNNHPDNLEWCTFRHNSNHAYELGLRGDSRAVIRYDLLTGSIEEWPSLAAAGRSVGRRPPIIFAWCNSTSNAVRDGRYVYRYADNPLTDDELDKLELDVHLNGTAKPCNALNVDTGAILKFESIGSASRNFGMTPACLYARVSKRAAVLTKNHFLYLASEHPPTEDELTAAKNRPGKGMYAYSYRDNKEMYFPTIQSASEALDIPYHRIVSALNGSRLYMVDGYCVKRVDDIREWPSESVAGGYVRGNPRPVGALNLSTEKVYWFDSVLEAGRALGIKHSYIAEMARKSKDIHHKGYVFRYKDLVLSHPFPEGGSRLLAKPVAGKPLVLRGKNIVTGECFSGLSSDEAAERIGITRAMVSNYYNSGRVINCWLLRSAYDVRPFPTLSKVLEYPGTYGAPRMYQATAGDLTLTFYKIVRLEERIGVNLSTNAINALRQGGTYEHGIWRVRDLVAETLKAESDVTDCKVAELST